MKKKILIALALMISIISGAQTSIKPTDLKGAEKSVDITFTAKENVITASYKSNLAETTLFHISLKFQDDTRGLMKDGSNNITLENYFLCSMVHKATGASTKLAAAGKDKFAIPNNLPSGTYNFLLNDKVIATNYKVQ